MNSLPSIESLAALAAAMSTPAENPASAANRALLLWQACADRLEKLSATNTARAADDDEERQFLANFKPDKPILLESFLQAVMPQSKVEDRVKKWRDYLRENIAFDDEQLGKPPRSTARLSADVVRIVRRDREEGVNHPLPVRRQFLAFLERDRREKNAERGKKAAIAKKSLGIAKGAKKLP